MTLGLRKANGLRVRQPLRTLRGRPAGRGRRPRLRRPRGRGGQRQGGRGPRPGRRRRGRPGCRHAPRGQRARGRPAPGPQVQAVIRAAKAGDWEQDVEGHVVVLTADGPVPLKAGEYELTTVVSAGDGTEVAAAVLPGGGVVVLSTALDDALVAEGRARDVVRAVQDARKAAGLRRQRPGPGATGCPGGVAGGGGGAPRPHRGRDPRHGARGRRRAGRRRHGRRREGRSGRMSGGADHRRRAERTEAESAAAEVYQGHPGAAPPSTTSSRPSTGSVRCASCSATRSARSGSST